MWKWVVAKKKNNTNFYKLKIVGTWSGWTEAVCDEVIYSVYITWTTLARCFLLKFPICEVLRFGRYVLAKLKLRRQLIFVWLNFRFTKISVLPAGDRPFTVVLLFVYVIKFGNLNCLLDDKWVLFSYIISILFSWTKLMSSRRFQITPCQSQNMILM